METAIESDRGEDQDDGLEQVIKILNGRVTAQVCVVNGKTQEVTPMFTFDFDNRDSVELVFKQNSESEESAEVEEESYIFGFQKQPGEEVEDLTTKRNQQTPESLEAAFGDALRQVEPEKPTFDDYMKNSSVELKDLSLQDQLAVLNHDIDLMYEALGRYGHKPAKKSLFKRLFSKAEDAEE